MSDKTQLYILNAILSDSNFAIKYIDKFEAKFFAPPVARVVQCVKKFFVLYHRTPTSEQLMKTLLPKLVKDDNEKLEESIDCIHECRQLEMREDFTQWIEDEAKTFIRIQRISHALTQCIEHLDKGDPETAANMVLKASEIHFDEDLGLDYFEDLEKRMEELRNPALVIPTGHDKLDLAIGGGWRNKSLIMFGAATNVGKTLILGHIAYKLIESGLDGLYITLEINQNILANRIDANLSDIGMGDLSQNVDELMQRILTKKKERDQVSKEDPTVKPFGRFIIKECPPGFLNANGIAALLRELQLKRNFRPKFICVDYIGLMVPNGKAFSDNTYGKMKTITEELRAVGVLNDIPIFSAVQVNREGYNTTHVGLEKTSDSMGIAHGADLMIMVSRDENADSENKMYWNVAKSRWSRNGQSFVMAVDYDHMRIVDEEQSQNEAQTQAVVDAISEYKSRTAAEKNGGKP